MKYSVSNNGKSNKLIQIEIDFEKVGEGNTEVYLPRWRPGRYVLVDYVQYVRDLCFMDMDGNEISFIQNGISSWKIKNKGKRFRAKYQYYCKDLDAGSTWVNNESLYVNPVNCLMYTMEGREEPCTVHLSLDYDYKIIVGAEVKNNSFAVQNFDALADSPFLACKNIIHERFEVDGVDFGISFWGECKPDMKKIITEFTHYTKEQFKLFGDFPVRKYEYIFIITPYAKYHGVEHQSSTVIALGPGYNLMSKKLDDLMGVSSHELFHTWNVKKIRPTEMFPYDFQSENFNKLGYVTEGVTTYYGDLMLKRSGYFNLEEYFKELETTFKRHFENEGRFNKSVADASYETWIDGYSKTAPHFKTNIYVEGSLCALMSDLAIRLNSEGSNSLDSLMKRMYTDFGKETKGYSEENYLSLLREFGGEKVESIITNHLYGVKDYEPELKELLAEFGIELYQEENDSKIQSLFGIQMNIDYTDIVERVSLCSEANDIGFSKGCKIIAVNGFAVNGSDVNSWVKYFSDLEEIQFTLLKDGCVNEKSLSVSDLRYFPKRKLKISKNITDRHKKRLAAWLGPIN